jgi:hypothetical protein
MYYQVRIFSPKERDFDGNLCASAKNSPLDMKLGSVPMNLKDDGVDGVHSTVSHIPEYKCGLSAGCHFSNSY